MQRAIVMAMMCVVLAGCGEAERLINTVFATPTPVLSQAELTMELCSLSSTYAEAADGGRTLILDGEGEESAGLNIEDLACALNYMDVPSFVVSTMEKTRALDGIQREEYGNFKISWSYHPDNGLDVVITEK